MTFSSFVRSRLAMSLGIGTIVAVVSVTSALAWSVPSGLHSNASGLSTFFNNCGASTGVWATDGDVVTTTKWNQLVCLTYQTLNVLYDWGRNQTPFITVQGGSIGANTGSYVSGVQLAAAGGGGSIGFYNSASAFALTSTQNSLGSIRYTNGVGEGLHMTSNNGPVYIDTVNNTSANSHANDETNGNKQFPLGWVSINLMDTTEFDPLCMYRVTTNHLHTIYMTAVSGGYIRSFLDANHDDHLGSPGRVGVPKENKTQLQNPIEVWSNTPTANYGTWVSIIEKLCLPRYFGADTSVHYYQWNGAGYPEYATIKKNMN